MRSLRSRLSALVVFLVLVAVSCGDGGDTTETTAVQTLAAALSSSASVDSYRIEVAVGNELSSSALGVESSTELDPDRPATVAVVTPDGGHVEIDVGALLEPMGVQPEAPLLFEMWTSETRMVFDTTSYQTLVDLNPFVDLGPFGPGVFSIDPAAVADLSRSEVITAVGGQSVDLASLAARLPAELADVEPLDERGTYRGTASMAGMQRALGGDIEDVAAGASAAMGQFGVVDAAALTQAYVDYYESTQVEVVVVVERGLLSTLAYDADVGRIYDHLFAEGRAEEIFGVTAAEAREARLAFADTVWTQSSLTTFIVDDDIEIDPPVPTEDRTAAFVDFMEAAGAFD